MDNTAHHGQQQVKTMTHGQNGDSRQGADPGHAGHGITGQVVKGNGQLGAGQPQGKEAQIAQDIAKDL